LSAKLALVTTKPSDIPEITPYRSLEWGVRAGTGKVSLDAAPFDDDAGGAALDEKIGHRIEIRRPRADRKSKPRLRHEFLCHRGENGSNDEKLCPLHLQPACQICRFQILKMGEQKE
jgi:hypothetical protein